ncbi:Aste57867_3403 [Aphanomyces stellatus]|uniref:Aste57867_3403 protein n=1 Tax=Aphanomyces stellatus TaxID=120398 RepID=A0A485KAN5_9STRA|nr:hypothetical protein As57867_003393 [Aphanomyces stellatus]VFT80569.1 Aste57867_3403 [Aphanomyces stellatus]
MPAESSSSRTAGTIQWRQLWTRPHAPNLPASINAASDDRVVGDRIIETRNERKERSRGQEGQVVQAQPFLGRCHNDVPMMMQEVAEKSVCMGLVLMLAKATSVEIRAATWGQEYVVAVNMLNFDWV